MDSVLGIQYDGGVILAADQMNTAYGALIYQANLDKIASLTTHSAMAVSGPNCDLVTFTDYIQRNLDLYELSNDGLKLSVAAQANFCRNELARALRRGPFQVNTLIGGYDENGKMSSLYWLDYLGTLHKIKYGCQGFATNFCLSLMDREYVDGMSKEAAVAIVERCIQEVQTRFAPSQPNFIIKCIDQEGVSVVKYGKDPADN